MKRYRKCVIWPANDFGIDISKDVFDVCDNNKVHYQFKNSISGFKKLVKLLDANTVCVMEAAGYYHVRLAYFLLESGIGVSVVNPLKIKRYIQMKLSKIKTGRACLIYLFSWSCLQYRLLIQFQTNLLPHESHFWNSLGNLEKCDSYLNESYNQ